MKKKSIAGLISISLSFVIAIGVFSSPLLSLADKAEKKQVPHSQEQKEADFKVTLLGTGSPLLSMERFGPATLIEAGHEKLLFDAGRGAALRLSQTNTMPGKLNKLFLTHMHSDHTIGIPDVWLTGSLPTAGKRDTAFEEAAEKLTFLN